MQFTEIRSMRVSSRDVVSVPRSLARQCLVAVLAIVCAVSVLAGTDAYRNSNQYKRSQWFWEPRHTSDNGYPSAKLYAEEAARIAVGKRDADVQAAPNWVELGPVAPDGITGGWQGIGRVNCLAISDKNADLMFLGSAHGGIWKTIDAGANWSAVNVPSLPTFGVSDIAFAPSDEKVMYVATGDANGTHYGNVANGSFSYGILKSVDGGLTWTSTGLNHRVDESLIVARLRVDPRNANVVVAATNIGLIRTSDGGVSWFAVSPRVYFRDLIGNATDPDVLNAATYSPGGGAAFYHSTDNGITWTEIEALPEVNRIRLSVTKANINMVMAVASQFDGNGLAGVYFSYDKGVNYDALHVPKNLLGYASDGTGDGGNGWYDLAAEISQTDETQRFVGGVNIWKSVEAKPWTLSAHWQGSGASWVHADQHFLKYHPTRNIVFACHDGGVAQSTDDGATWTDISKGLKIQQYYALACSNVNTTLTIAGAQDNSTMLTMDGVDFKHVLAADGMDNAVDPRDPNVMYGGWQNGVFFHTEDAWKTSEYIASPDLLGAQGGAWVSPIVTHPTISGTLFIGYSHVYKSTDYGKTWETLTTDAEDGHLRHLAIAPSNPDFIYAATSSVLKYSTNGGETWSRQEGLSLGYIQDVAVHPSIPRRYWVTYGGYQSGLKIVEVNDGVVENITGDGLGNVPCNTVRYLKGDPDRVFVGTDIGVFSKLDSSTKWYPYGNGMPTTIVTDMEYIEPTKILRVATYGRGIWEVPIALCATTPPTIKSANDRQDVCLGDSIILEAPSQYHKYYWSNGATSRTQVLNTVNQSGEYWVQVEDPFGCIATSNTLTINIHPRPPRPTISRNADTLRSSGLSATSFQWYRNGVSITDATSRTLVMSDADGGEFTVETISSDECVSIRSLPFAYNINSVYDRLNAQSLLVHPNPAESDLHVQLPEGTSRTLELLDVRGGVTVSQSIDDVQTACTLSLESVASGTYYLRVRAGAASWMAVVVRI